MTGSARLRFLIPAACALCYIAQCLWFIGTQSLTYDEPAHIVAGLDAWRHGRFEQWNDQPPLARLLLTAPLLGGPWRLETLDPPLNGAFWTVVVRPNAERLAWHTRPVNVAIGLMLAWLLWTTARRMFSEGGANLALALFAFSPPFIAHFSVATVDGAAALFLFATAVTTARWSQHPSWPRTLGLAAVLGGFLLAKLSAPPLVLLAAAMMVLGGATRPWADRLAKAGAALAIALLLVWAAYFFHVGPINIRSGSMSGPYARQNSVIVPMSGPLNVTVRVPAPEYLTAFGGVAQHGVRGQPSFLLGEVRRSGGWRSYFPVVGALKWPLIVWLIAGATLALFAFGPLAPPEGLGLTMTFPIVFFGFAVISNINVGDRFILPVYPFLLLLGAGAWNAIRKWRFALPFVVMIVGLQAADALRYAPDYLSYFNAFVRPERSYQLLSDSNLDWGQGLIALRRFERSHPGDKISLAYFGGVDPRDYGIRAQPFSEGERPTGTVVVSATHLSGQYLDNPSAYHWLLRYPRTAILNHTLHVFEVR